MANSLNLQTVELTTSISTAPLNGPPSSANYNESQREVLADLSNISTFINDSLLPLLNVLQATSLGSTRLGIQGSTIITDNSDTTDTFFDSIDGLPLTVADSLRILRALITTLQQEFIDIDIQVATLQSKLSSTNQDDISAALAGLQSTVSLLTSSVSSALIEINNLNSSLGTFVGSVVTSGAIPAGGTIQVQVNLSVPYSDNNYTPVFSLEDLTGQLQIISFTYQPAGLGIFVLVKNYSTTTAIAGNIHTLTKHF